MTFFTGICIQTGPRAHAGPLAALADTREFFEMRMVLQQNPQLLVPLLTELGKANPAIIQVRPLMLITNEVLIDGIYIFFKKGLDAFVLFVLLLAPPAYCATLRQAFNENQGEFLRLLNDQSTAMPGVQRLQVTQEEKEAIDRVRTMFF